jgi:hypothetical protein
MRSILLISAFIFSQTLFSQESETLDSLWTKRGKVGVLLNQVGFSDWVGGGTNNFSGTILRLGLANKY